MNSESFRKNHLEKYKMYKVETEDPVQDNITKKEYISKDPKELSLFFKEEGNRFFIRKEYDVALIYFTKAIDYDSSNKIYYSNRSACHLAKGQYRMALKDALKCLELDSTYVKGYYRAAMAYFEMNQLDRAAKIVDIYKNICTGDDVDYLVGIIKTKKEENEKLMNKFPNYNKFVTFATWLHDSDVHFSKLNIHFYSDDHRGVIAKQDIYKDEILLSVPKDSLISIELAKTTEIGAKIASFMYIALNSPKHCLLTSFILTEKLKGEDSKWKAYLDILPKDYSSFPIFYTDEELSFLEGSPFLMQILEKKSDIQKDYEKICSYIPEFEKFSYLEFCEYRMAVSSRIFGVKIDFRKTDVLAPFADLLNHKRPRTTHWFYDERYKAFIIQSLENIPQGAEVYDSYGKKCNSRFLLNYGFVIEDNDANEFPITLQLDETCPHFETKKGIFLKDTDYIKTFRISANILEFQVVDLFSFLRFILYEGDMKNLFKLINDNQKLSFDESTPSFFLISPMDKESEIKLLKKIEELMISYLTLYKTTLEEDEEMISKDKNGEMKLTNNQRNCVLMRISEKQILHYFLDFAKYCLELYNMSEEEIREKVREDYPDEDCSFEFYIFEVILKFNKSK